MTRTEMLDATTTVLADLVTSIVGSTCKVERLYVSYFSARARDLNAPERFRITGPAFDGGFVEVTADQLVKVLTDSGY